MAHSTPPPHTTWLCRYWRWLASPVVLLSLCAIVLAGTVQRAVEHVPWDSNHVAQATKTAQQQPTRDMQRRTVHAELPLGPLLFIGLLLGVGALWGKALGVEATAEQAERVKRRRRKPAERSLEDEIQRIRSNDPAFDTEAFLRRSSHAFRLFQRAWTNQNLPSIRHLVSDAIYERSVLQIADLGRRGVREFVEDLIVREKTIAQVDLDEYFQTITVRFRTTARRYAEDAQGHPLPGHRFPQSVVEYWAFVRRPGATTLDSGGLIEGSCPNCGTPLHLNESGVCRSCDAKVWSGRYDWVLTEITHQSEWRMRPHHDVPGVPTLAEIDPAFCLQQLHDRVNAMFWRRITAWQAGDVTMLRNVATAEYCQILAEELDPDPDGTRRIPAAVGVGAVETEGILCEAPLDRALIRIHWSSGAERVRPDATRQQTIPVGFRVSFFLLTRKHGAQGSLDDGLSSSHCRACGAPATSSNAAVCEHCGTPFMDKERDWLLANVYFEDEQPVRDFLSRLQDAKPHRKSRARSREAVRLSPVSGRQLVAWAVHVMLIDDEINAEEKKQLESLATKHGVQEAELKGLVLAAQAGELELGIPEEANTTRACLEAMAEMALADGSVTAAERETMHTLGRRLGFGKRRIAKTIIEARKRLARQGRQRLKALRREH